MKKKKWTAVIVCAVLAGSLFTAMPAEALYQITFDMEIPDGYEQVEDADAYYPIYWRTDHHSNFMTMNNYHCNVLFLTVPKEKLESYRELETQYADFFASFDESYENTLYDDVVQIRLWDVLEKKTNLIEDLENAESKEGIVRKMCQTLREADVIESAEYYPYCAQVVQGFYSNVMTIWNVPKTEQEQLLAAFKQLGYEDVILTWNESTGNYSARASAFQNADGILAATKALEKNYEGAKAEPILEVLDNSSVNASAVDMMNLPLISYGDPDDDGTVSVEDAVWVLTYYAQQSAGLEAQLTQATATEESAFLAADVDGDGQITVEDAVAILTYYAKKSAGLDAAW
ncbi:MAG: dockerin type I domain-containing protein [Oscillospiraceae bacterium]|nr:dockerin type I domain-containing protein [Oscillospiraceae bacterium]